MVGRLAYQNNLNNVLATKPVARSPSFCDYHWRRFVNVRFSLRFVMVSVSDPIPDDDSDDDGDSGAPDSPGVTLSHALADVDIM